MIVVNYFLEKDYNPDTDGNMLVLAGVINDSLDLDHDIQLIKDCILNDPDFEPKTATLYELQLIRATIQSDPIDEPAFAIDRVIEKVYQKETGEWITPLVRM